MSSDLSSGAGPTLWINEEQIKCLYWQHIHIVVYEMYPIQPAFRSSNSENVNKLSLAGVAKKHWRLNSTIRLQESLSMDYIGISNGNESILNKKRNSFTSCRLKQILSFPFWPLRSLGVYVKFNSMSGYLLEIISRIPRNTCKSSNLNINKIKLFFNS